MRQHFTAKAKINGFWYRLGFATQVEGGNVLVTLNTVPTNWNGEFKLFLEASKNAESSDRAADVHAQRQE